MTSTSMMNQTSKMRTMTSSDNEIWKDIPEYEGQYQVSDLGRVRSLGRYIEVNDPKRRPFKKYREGQILKPGKSCKSGHLSVVLSRGSSSIPVHQLVMITFIGKPKDNEEVRHLNGIPTDNRLENLVYGTRTENILDVYWIGRAWRKLTIEDVIDIRERLAKGDPGAQIARDYKVSQATISAVKRGYTYKWLTTE